MTGSPSTERVVLEPRFFAVVSTKLHGLRQREALLALGWLIFLGTAIWLATSLVQSG